MKKLIISLFLSVIFILNANHSSANSNIKVYLFDELVDMDNPVIINGNTLVPLRALFESLGSHVYWDDQSRTIRATKGDTVLLIPIGSKKVTKNNEEVALEEPASIINEKTYVPLRFVAESFNQNVRWDQENNSVYIGKELTAKDISKLDSPAVVYVETFDRQNKLYSSGSGFIIDSSGVIVTNYHVINVASSATVTLTDGKKYPILKVINYDVKKDIAVVKIDTSRKLPVIPMGNSDKLENGDKIFALGSPKGLQNTISEGIVSNKNRTIGDRTFIQISAEITHGSSGGALINTKGEVVGITSNGLGEADLNFAIPIKEVGMLQFIDKNLSVNSVYEIEHTIQYTNGYYIGDKQNGAPHGVGGIVWNNGEQYIGDWLNGVRTGKGKYTWTNGTVYEGDFLNGEQTGKGKITWPNGNSYEGSWVNNIKQGYGKFYEVPGHVYEGQFVNDLPNGKGTIRFATGDTYVGDFVNWKFNGYGILTYANGRVLAGIWSNGDFIR